jgi:hypothetical protein
MVRQKRNKSPAIEMGSNSTVASPQKNISPVITIGSSIVNGVKYPRLFDFRAAMADIAKRASDEGCMAKLIFQTWVVIFIETLDLSVGNISGPRRSHDMICRTYAVKIWTATCKFPPIPCRLIVQPIPTCFHPHSTPHTVSTETTANLLLCVFHIIVSGPIPDTLIWADIPRSAGVESKRPVAIQSKLTGATRSFDFYVMIGQVGKYRSTSCTITAEEDYYQPNSDKSDSTKSREGSVASNGKKPEHDPPSSNATVLFRI